MNLHFFNPGHEAAVFNGSPFYVAPANVRLMQREFAFLPAWYAQSDDFVLVEQNFDFSFFENLTNYFPNLPQPVSCNQNFILNFNNSKYDFNGSVNALCWGISPAAIHFFEKIQTKNEINLRVPKWENEFRNLCSRQTANDCMVYLKNKIPQIKVAVPQFINSMQTLENVIDNSRGTLIAKLPFSSSGRGILKIDSNNFSRATRQIINGWLRRQGSICVEPKYEKIMDFALEFFCERGINISFVGYSHFETDKKGSYIGNFLDSQKNIENKILQYIDNKLFTKIKIELQNFLNEKYKNYTGFLGIDMLIYIFENQYFIYPCVEINMRANMGILAINFVEKYLFSGKTGCFSVDFCKNSGEVYEKHNEMTKKFPPQFVHGKLYKGYLPLCPIDKNSKFWTYALVD